jgi:hypothetical protein
MQFMLTKKTKFIIGLVGVVVLYQGGKWGYGEAAQSYFDYKCESEAGEFIYRTVENVEGLFQMRLRDPRDMIDRLRKGDFPEDPYGHTNWESQRPWTMFVEEPYFNYQYFETTKGPDLKDYDLRRPKKFAKRPEYTGEKYWIYYGRSHIKNTQMIAEQVSSLRSQYGFTWKEVRGVLDKLFGIWGGELIVKQLDTDEVLGLRKGFSFINKIVKRGGHCPKREGPESTYQFVSKVLIPAKRAKGEQDVN